MDSGFKSFEEFWPFYVSQHMNDSCRALHFVGTTLVLGALAAGALLAPAWLLAAPPAGYACAWAGHYLFEKNRPATFSHPLWSLRGDFRMYRLMLLRSMAPELKRAKQGFRASA